MKTNFAPLAALALALAACADADPTGVSAEGAGPSAVVVPLCVEFDVPPLGSVFGSPAGNVPGQVVFAENGIDVSVHKFAWLGGGSAFNRVDIIPAPAGFGAGQVASVNNIDLGFDLTGLPFVATAVKFQWRDLGGYENLRVNSSALHVGELTAAPSPLGGVNVTHAWAAIPGGKQGTTTLSGGVVKGFIVGGQEFYLDNVCAYP